MIKLGVFLDEIAPTEGGASSLLTTIQNEIQSAMKDHKVVVLYNGKPMGKYKIKIDEVEYINVAARPICHWVAYTKKIINHMLKNTVKGFLYYNKKLAESSWLDEIANREKIDIIWFTYPVCEKTSVPYIYTVWDLGHRVLPMLPEVNDSWNNREHMYQEMLYHASYIITGNEYGKREIQENYTLNPNKIRVIPFPVSDFCKGVEKKPSKDIPEKYFFYPAQFWAHKNHVVILKALEILRDKYGKHYNVVFTGSDKGNKGYIKNMADALGLTDQIYFVGFVSYEEMKYLYTHSVGSIFASLMGPNNLPPVEATYLNCPVIITDIPGHIEQLKDTALYFNGTNETQLAEHMLAIYENKDGICDRLKNEQNRIDLNRNYVNSVIEIIKEFELIIRTWHAI